MNKFHIIPLAALLAVTAGLWLTNSSIEKKNYLLAAQLSAARLERDAAQGEINRQNCEIAAMAVDQEAMRVEMAQLRAKSAVVRTEYVERLVKDNSCENQLRLIKEAQEAFYEHRN